MQAMNPTAPARPPRALWLGFLVFLGPLVLSNVLQALSGTLNAIYVGRLLGAPAMAAVGGFFPVLMFFLSFVIGLGAGASILVGQAWGARDLPKVRQVAATALGVALWLGLAVAVAGALLAGPLLRFMGTPPEVLPIALTYARAMMFALPLLFGSILVTSVLRGVGDTVTPLLMLLVSIAVTVVVTPALIRGVAGLPALGVAGAGWSTVVASVVALGALAAWLRWRGHTLAPRPAGRWLPRIDRSLLRTMVRLGVPTGLFFVTGSLADLALVSLVNLHGAQATATWGLVNQIMAYVQFPAMSIAIAASILAAQAIGAGRLERIGPITRVGLMFNIVLTGGLALTVLVLSGPITGLFISDTAVRTLTQQVLAVTVWGSVLFGLASVFSGVMRASGTVLVPTLLSLGCLAFLIVPLGWIFDQTLGVRAIWAAYPVTFACALVLQALYFYGVWRRKPIQKLV